MRHSFTIQALLHLPSLSFLLLLAAAIFLLPEDEQFETLYTETVVSDIIWSRHTPTGEGIQLRAPYLTRQADGIVHIKDVSMEIQQQQSQIYLHGEEGLSGQNYQQITLTNANGTLSTSADNGNNIILSLAVAHYNLDNNHLSGEKVSIRENHSVLTGENFSWNQQIVHLRGNVHAVFRVAETEQNSAKK